MNKKKRRLKRQQETTTEQAAQSATAVTRMFISLAAVAVLMTAFVYCMRWLSDRDSSRSSRTRRQTSVARSEPQRTSDGESQTNEEDSSGERQDTEASVDVDALKPISGSWRRTDAGYTIEIEEIRSDGSLKAAYYNPSPINVSRAEASQDEDTIKIVVEMRDVGYPGSTYDLVYDAEGDRLVGTYFAAASGQQFEVEFERVR
jgi:hypothetical protein